MNKPINKKPEELNNIEDALSEYLISKSDMPNRLKEFYNANLSPQKMRYFIKNFMGAISYLVKKKEKINGKIWSLVENFTYDAMFLSSIVPQYLIGILPIEKAHERKYTNMNEERFIYERVQRPWNLDPEMGKEILKEWEKKEKETRELYDELTRDGISSDYILRETNGRSGASFIAGEFLSAGREFFYEEILPINRLWMPKVDKNETRISLEYETMKILQNDEKANVAEVREGNKNGFFIKRAGNISLQEITEIAYVKRIMLGNDEEKEQIKEQYKELISESMHISNKLTNSQMIERKDDIIKLKLNNLPYRFKKSKDEILKHYEAYRLTDTFNLDETAREILFKMTDRIYKNKKRGNIIITDRSPSNRLAKNIDFNKIELEGIAQELTMIINKVAGYFNEDEQNELIKYGIKEWNKVSGENIKHDSNFMNEFYFKTFYRSMINANHYLNEAVESQFLYTGNHFKFFRYAKKALDGREQYKLSLISLNNLLKANIINNREYKILTDAFSTALNSNKKYINPIETEIDLRVHWATDRNYYNLDVKKLIGEIDKKNLDKYNRCEEFVFSGGRILYSNPNDSEIKRMVSKLRETILPDNQS